MAPSTSSTLAASSSTEIASILLVDDDARLRNLLQRFLEDKGYSVKLAHNADQMYAQMQQHSFSLIVLDYMLPGANGLQICKQLRANGDQTPIMMLTAKGDDNDRVAGLEAGADDYLTKPFNPSELLLRIKAVLRRNPVNTTQDLPVISNNAVAIGDWWFDSANRTLAKAGQVVSLSSGEYTLLKTLVQHPNTVISKEKLLALHQREWAGVERSVETYISRLRRLLEPTPSQPTIIVEVWGGGYKLVVNEPSVG